MTDATAALAYASPASERPRVSAASFRNLTARLKKVADADPIPAISPLAVDAPAMPAPSLAETAPPLADTASRPAHAEPAPKPKTLRRILKNPLADPFQRQSAQFELPDFVPLQPVAAGAAPVAEPVEERAEMLVEAPVEVQAETQAEVQAEALAEAPVAEAPVRPELPSFAPELPPLAAATAPGAVEEAAGVAILSDAIAAEPEASPEPEPEPLPDIEAAFESLPAAENDLDAVSEPEAKMAAEPVLADEPPFAETVQAEIVRAETVLDDVMQAEALQGGVAEEFRAEESEPEAFAAADLQEETEPEAPVLAHEPVLEAEAEIGPEHDASLEAGTPEIDAEADFQAEPGIEAMAETPEVPAAETIVERQHAQLGHTPPTPAESAIDAARKEHLSRKEALELEIVWRSLLATPTLEERASFVREVADALAALGQDLPAPAPEHDLSTIAPADPETVVQETRAQPVEPASHEPGPLVARPQAEASQQNDNAEVARSLLDMMATGSKSGLPHERALAADTLLRLVPKLDIKPLIMMAQRLAKADNPPAMLVAKLIRDSRVEVAGPLLEDCAQITDKDLEIVVAEGSAAKLRMLARRRHLTVAISDALIKTRDPSVLLTLVRNMDAAISQEGFYALIRAAEDEKELLAPLCTRPDLPAPLAFELFWSAPAQLRRFILSRFLTDSETLSKILKITLSTNDTAEALDSGSNNQHVLMEALERAARGKFEIAADELAQALQIIPATAMRILHDAEGEPLMVMLKVAGYPRQALHGLMKRFRDSDLPLLSSGRDIEELQSIFDTLSFNKARILLTYWDWAQRKTGPYAPLH